MFRPEDYSHIPTNRHDVAAGAILLPTEKPIALGGGTSLQFVLEQGGDQGTFIFLLGVRHARGPLGVPIEFLEGVFLSEGGRGFRATWGFEQLLREIDAGGWRVIPVRDVLDSWTGRVEERMNRGEAG
jgi:hypothetical protein